MTTGLNPIIAHAIQLAVAPVFLMTAIAGLLGVMANRLARVIDRARTLEAAWDGLSEPAREAALAEFRSLERRRHFASWAINFCATAALIVCIVITTLFLEEFFQANLTTLAGGLFICAMGAHDSWHLNHSAERLKLSCADRSSAREYSRPRPPSKPTTAAFLNSSVVSRAVSP